MEGFRLSEEDERKIKALSREPGIAKRVLISVELSNSRYTTLLHLVFMVTKTSKRPLHSPFLAVFQRISMANTPSEETSTFFFSVILVQPNLKFSNMLRKPPTVPSLRLVKVPPPSVSQPVSTKTPSQVNGH